MQFDYEPIRKKILDTPIHKIQLSNPNESVVPFNLWYENKGYAVVNKMDSNEFVRFRTYKDIILSLYESGDGHDYIKMNENMKSTLKKMPLYQPYYPEYFFHTWEILSVINNKYDIQNEKLVVRYIGNSIGLGAIEATRMFYTCEIDKIDSKYFYSIINDTGKSNDIFTTGIEYKNNFDKNVIINECTDILFIDTCTLFNEQFQWETEKKDINDTCFICNNFNKILKYCSMVVIRMNVLSLGWIDVIDYIKVSFKHFFLYRCSLSNPLNPEIYLVALGYNYENWRFLNVDNCYYHNFRTEWMLNATHLRDMDDDTWCKRHGFHTVEDGINDVRLEDVVYSFSKISLNTLVSKLGKLKKRKVFTQSNNINDDMLSSVFSSFAMLNEAMEKARRLESRLFYDKLFSKCRDILIKTNISNQKELVLIELLYLSNADTIKDIKSMYISGCNETNPISSINFFCKIVGRDPFCPLFIYLDDKDTNYIIIMTNPDCRDYECEFFRNVVKMMTILTTGGTAVMQIKVRAMSKTLIVSVMFMLNCVFNKMRIVKPMCSNDYETDAYLILEEYVPVKKTMLSTLVLMCDDDVNLTAKDTVVNMFSDNNIKYAEKFINSYITALIDIYKKINKGMIDMCSNLALNRKPQKIDYDTWVKRFEKN